jgi:hypothetical protein
MKRIFPRFFASFVFFTVTSPCWSQSDSLQAVDDFLGPRIWEQEFARPLELVGDWNECTTTLSCDGYGIRSLIAAHDSATETVAITTWLGANGDPSPSKLKKSDWQTSRGNLVRMDVMNKQSYGYRMTVASIEAATFTAMLNGQSLELPALKIKADGLNGAGHTLAVEYTVVKDINGLGQIALKIETQDWPVKVVRTRNLREANWN